MNPETASGQLARALQLAHAGELGAIRAYLGHRACLREPAERNAIAKILKDEIRHRRGVREMLNELGVTPDPAAERRLDLIGRFISFLCFIGGWFFPMYGAARFEANNIVEYEVAARLAWTAGHRHMVDPLLEMGEVEWDHEFVLREYASHHVLWRVMPKWTPPEPRETIRLRFATWVTEQSELIPA